MASSDLEIESELSLTNDLIENKNWTRLALAVKIHGNKAVQYYLKKKELKLHNPQKLHLQIAGVKGNIERVPGYIWKKLLGSCHVSGCQENCDGKTDLDNLDFTALNKIVKNIKHIIPDYSRLDSKTCLLYTSPSPRDS